MNNNTHSAVLLFKAIIFSAISVGARSRSVRSLEGFSGGILVARRRSKLEGELSLMLRDAQHLRRK